MDKIVLSIVIPVYGVERYIKNCLDTLDGQLTDEVEIIVVDDGSRDSCPQICDGYSERSGFKIIHKENGGLASSVIRGIEESRGEYIGFCDGDDYVADDYVENVLKAIREHSPDVIYFDYNRLESGGKRKKTVGSVDVSPKLYKNGECKALRDLYMKRGGISPCRWNKVIKREYVNMTLEYYSKEARIGEDIIFTAPIIYEMRSFYYIDKPLINYNVNEGSMTVNFTKTYIDNFYLVFDSLSRFFGNGSAFLGYIHYINMRTLVNSIAKSSVKGKVKYLNSALESEEFKKRIAHTDKSALPFYDKMLLSLMKKEWASPLVLIADAYRGAKWLH